MKSLSLYQQQIELLRRERAKLDEDFAQVLAEGLNDGYAIIDLLDAPQKNPAQTKLEFDL